MKKTFLIFLQSTVILFTGFIANAASLEEHLANGENFQDFLVHEARFSFQNFEPKISNRLIFDVGFEDRYQATNRQNEFNDSTANLRFYSNFKLFKRFQINSYLRAGRLDSIKETERRRSSAHGGGDRSFENLGAYFEELNISSNHENYSLMAGKFDLDFGTAWRWDRGLWIHNFAQDNYKQIEKLGLSGVYRIGDEKKTGRYNFGFSTFTNDRKNLDNSFGAQRSSSQKSDATPGDVRGLQSYNASLNINFDFASNEKLTYNFSYLSLAVNRRASQLLASKIADQKSFVAGLNYQYPLNSKIDLDALLEYAKINNFGGNKDASQNYFTANLITHFYHNYSFLVGNSLRRNYQLGLDSFEQNLSEISIGYEFDKNIFFDKLTLQAGYKMLRGDRRDTLQNVNLMGANSANQNSFGLLLRYYKNF